MAAPENELPEGTPLKVYLLGASGTGKTTLAVHIGQSWGIPRLTGAVQAALDELNRGRPKDMKPVGWDSFDTDLFLADDFQREVWRQQQALEMPYYAAPRPFVTDRGFDLLAYTAGHARNASSIFKDAALENYIKRLKQPGTVVLFLRPHPDVKAPLDGRRDRFLEPAWVHRVDGVIEFLLESNGVPYAPVGTPSFKDRVRLADRLIKAASGGG